MLLRSRSRLRPPRRRFSVLAMDLGRRRRRRARLHRRARGLRRGRLSLRPTAAAAEHRVMPVPRAE
eukprot:30809-Pelagococcus_subviridis.AAC.5